MEKAYCTAIILAAGSGKRMGTRIHKQYLELEGKPLLYYSLKAFQASAVIDEIILVTGAGEEEYCKKEIVEKYGLSKVKAIIKGGAQRYDSVWNALKLLPAEGYAFIHDGARPFVDPKIIGRAFETVQKKKACIAAMPVKDTIKIAGADGNVEYTPDRGRTWLAQTPQTFENSLIKEAYARLMECKHGGVTDDASAVEQMLKFPVAFTPGSYDNIKITTPEDMEIAKTIMKNRKIKIILTEECQKEGCSNERRR